MSGHFAIVGNSKVVGSEPNPISDRMSSCCWEIGQPALFGLQTQRSLCATAEVTQKSHLDPA